jgi:tetratricopeptide (TPR) repeat protein
VAHAVVCAACGAKIRAGRGRCPRCRAVIAAPDPARAAASSRRLRKAAAVLVGICLVTIAGLWVTRAPAPITPKTTAPAADPLGARRAAGAPAARGPAPASDQRSFLDPAGAAGIAYGAGDYKSALAQYQAAVERNPQDAESLSNLGQVLVRLNRTAEAIPYFERAIAILPNRWAYQFNLARALGLVGRTDDAVAAYRRAQQLFPDDYVTAFNLGLALHKSGNEEAAVEQYHKAISLEPNDASFRKALATSYERLQKPAEAVGAYQEYLRLSPSSADSDKVRARIAQLTASHAGSDSSDAPDR